ncbi:hypothetical protein KJ815_00670 [bacterium]|nr:hypothetical protein [bacterium]
MPALLDYGLVVFAVAAACGYLAWRRIRKARRLSRDWTTGRVEACDSCPVIRIREAQAKRS